MNKKKFLKIIFINSFLLFSLLTLGELLTRSFFPDFRGDYYSKKTTRSKNFYKGIIEGIPVVRIPNNFWRANTNSDLLILIGDSITQGFGMAYEDIYWVKLKSLYDLTKKNNLEVLPFGGYGTNLYNIDTENLKNISDKFSKKKYVIYQFNFNDIQPKDGLKSREEIKVNNIERKFRELSISHLQKSVFFRVVKHFGGLTYRNRLKNKTCKQKGWLSLQQYTFTFASEGFEKVSDVAWSEFEKDLINLQNLSKQINAELVVFISPIIYDIDLNGSHPFMNAYGVDFSCATINPRTRLEKISKTNQIKLIDPTFYMREKFESSLNEENFLRFFYAADDNHITPRAATHLSHFLFSEIFYKVK